MDSKLNLIINFLLQAYLTLCFELTSIDKQEEVLHLHLEELHKISFDYSNDQLQSKGFFESISLQDFPIRKHKIYLHIKRKDNLIYLLRNLSIKIRI